jgi:predicted TIM-barrel fold metal-dependent hydrolase
MFDALVACASDLGLTVAIHTGFIFSVNAKSNANQLHNLIGRFPNVRFDLYHLNYPWVDEIYNILCQYQNTTANCVWAEYIDPAGTEDFLYRCLGSLSANRVIAYGSDGGGLDFVLASLSLTKDLIAAALSRLVDRSQISKSSALEVARIWLYEAPVEAFKLKCG